MESARGVGRCDAELDIVRTDGSRATVLASLASIRLGREVEAFCLAMYDVSTLRRSEKALAEQATFPEMNPGPVCRMDRSGIILLVNTAARNLFGDTELLGKCWLDVCPGPIAETWPRILSGETIPPLEGNVRGLWVSFAHVRSSSGTYIHAYGTDITERRRVENEIKEMARFPEMNPGPVVRTGLEGTMLLANAAARAVFGGNLVGRGWRETCPGMDARLWERILAAEAVVPVELRVGERDFIFSHRREPGGNLVFIFGADVTAQKKAERALRQAEKMATLGTLSAGVAHELNNPAAAARRAADQLTDAFGRFEDAERSLSRVPLSMTAQEALEGFRERARAQAQRRTFFDSLERSDREAAAEGWLEGRGIRDPAAIAPALVDLGLNVQALDAFAGQVGGDALMPALAWAASAAPVYALVQEIGHASARISEIVKALSSYSYLGQAPVQMVDLREGLDSTLVMLGNKLRSGITVRREYSDLVPRVPAYGSELNQVWTNLLDNAADALGGKGEITIRTGVEGEWAVVHIEDNGPGIPESIQPRIFDPFFTTKEPGKGTGLGLSMSHGIIAEKHGGDIRVESRPGFTRFTVRLPIQEARKEKQK